MGVHSKGLCEVGCVHKTIIQDRSLCVCVLMHGVKVNPGGWSGRRRKGGLPGAFSTKSSNKL